MMNKLIAMIACLGMRMPAISKSSATTKTPKAGTHF